MTTETRPGALLVSVREAADMLGVGRDRIFEEIASGRLASIKLGHRRLISVQALEAWVRDREAEAAQ